MKIDIPQKVVEQIAESLEKGKTVEIAVRKDRLVVWENSSKKKYDEVIAARR
jgi:antitoxin component of MazEF toxin-antitoxin module